MMRFMRYGADNRYSSAPPPSTAQCHLMWDRRAPPAKTMTAGIARMTKAVPASGCSMTSRNMSSGPHKAIWGTNRSRRQNTTSLP